MNRITLFCIPFAGGSAEVTYAKWRTELGSSVKVVPLEPAGHGRRMNEPFSNSIEESAKDLLGIVIPHLEESELYGVYAHSMGTLIAYELLRLIKVNRLEEPEAVFISGRLPPCHEYSGSDIHTLPRNEFIASLKSIDGSPKEIYNIPALMDVFLPIIRNDYKLTETYKFTMPRITIASTIHCFYSDNDKLVNRKDMEKWRLYGTGDFEIEEYQGHHFFINDHYREICKSIKRILVRDTVNV